MSGDKHTEERLASKFLKTNDQLTPKPPTFAPPRKDYAPAGMVGTDRTAKTVQQLRAEAEALRQRYEREQRNISLTRGGGLSREFDLSR